MFDPIIVKLKGLEKSIPEAIYVQNFWFEKNQQEYAFQLQFKIRSWAIRWCRSRQIQYEVQKEEPLKEGRGARVLWPCINSRVYRFRSLVVYRFSFLAEFFGGMRYSTNELLALLEFCNIFQITDCTKGRVSWTQLFSTATNPKSRAFLSGCFWLCLCGKRAMLWARAKGGAISVRHLNKSTSSKSGDVVPATGGAVLC